MENWPEKAGPKVPKRSPQTVNIREKVDNIWNLEVTVTHVPKIMKICALRNSEIVFSRGRGFIFQGFRHLQKFTKIVSKWRLNWAKNQENVVQRPLKNSLEKHIQKTTKTSSKYLPKGGKRKRFFFFRFMFFWGLETTVLPGWSQGVSQAPSRVKLDPKGNQNGGQNGGQNRLDWARPITFCCFLD